MSSSQPIVFLGGPFSAAMRVSPAGTIFDPVFRNHLELVMAALQRLKVGMLSAHLADSYGVKFDEAAMVPRDHAWVHSCDIYIGLLPLDGNGEPYRTDGTFVEIGLAIAYGKRVLLAIENLEHPRQSWFVKNLFRMESVRIVEWDNFMANLDQELLEETGHITQDVAVSPVQRAQTTNAGEVLDRLALEPAHEVEVKGLRLTVLPGVFSPKYSHAPDYIIENWIIPAGARVLDVGSGSGVIGLHALCSGAGSLVAIDVNPVACKNTSLNAAALGLSDRVTVYEGSAYQPLRADEFFDVIILSPPYWNRSASTDLEKACYDDGHRFLTESVLGAKAHLKPGGHVYVVFSDQGDVSYLTHLIETSGLKTSRLLLKRPSIPDGHIRLFYDLIS
jgi:methylase of polypeptide subunit release factors